MTMKQKQDKPPQYLIDSFFKHLDKVFKELPYLPSGTSNGLYNAYRLGKKEFNRIKQYRNYGTEKNRGT